MRWSKFSNPSLVRRTTAATSRSVLRAGERILDLGCGTGELTLALQQRGCEAVGVDLSPEMVAAAKEKGVDARVMDGHSMAFEDEFDAVFSNAALHWMSEDPGRVVQSE